MPVGMQPVTSRPNVEKQESIVTNHKNHIDHTITYLFNPIFIRENGY